MADQPPVSPAGRTPEEPHPFTGPGPAGAADVPVGQRLQGDGIGIDPEEIDCLRDSTSGRGRRRQARHGRVSPVRNALEWVGVIAGALVVALVIRSFLLAAFYIPSPSMLPTLQKNDRVLVNKLSYRLHDVHRGDVVVFERPPNEADQRIKDLIKRVIGLPGETIEAKDGRVIINGRYLEEPYLRLDQTGCPGTENLPPTIIPADHVFVMGDNRCDSSDSRVFGPIPEDLIVGRAFVRVWPITHLGWL